LSASKASPAALAAQAFAPTGIAGHHMVLVGGKTGCRQGLDQPGRQQVKKLDDSQVLGFRIITENQRMILIGIQ